MRRGYGWHDADATEIMQPSASVKTSDRAPIWALAAARCAWNDRPPHRTEPDDASGERPRPRQPADDGADRVSRQRQNDAAAPRADVAGARPTPPSSSTRSARSRSTITSSISSRATCSNCRAAACAAPCARTSRAPCATCSSERESRRDPAFRRIVVETSGLADPAPILFTLGVDPMLDQRLRLGRVVTLVDAVSGAAQPRPLRRSGAPGRGCRRSGRSRRPTWRRSTPNSPPRSMRSTPAPSASSAPPPSDPATCCSGGAVPPPQPSPASGGGRPGGASHPPLLRGGGPRSGGGGRRRQPTSHGIDTYTVILGGAISRLDFAKALGGLAQDRGNDCCGSRASSSFADRPDRPAVVQAAQHAMFAPEWLDDWPDADTRSRLVFIVHDIAPAEILARISRSPHAPNSSRRSRDLPPRTPADEIPARRD